MNAEDAYRRYFPLVRHRCRRLLGDGQLAGDIAQETFVRFLATNVVGDDARVVRWLYVCCGNLAIDELRKRRAAVAELAPAHRDPHAETAAMARALVLRLVEQVGRDEVLTALLTHVDGLTHEETAVTMGVSERTVRRWLVSIEAAAQALDAPPEVRS